MGESVNQILQDPNDSIFQMTKSTTHTGEDSRTDPGVEESGPVKLTAEANRLTASR